MKAFLIACIALVALALGANFALDTLGWTSAEQGTSPGAVRLD